MIQRYNQGSIELEKLVVSGANFREILITGMKIKKKL